jgi:hypothetical protein
VQIRVFGGLLTWWKSRSLLGRLAVALLLVCLGIAAWWTWVIISTLINPHSDPLSRDYFRSDTLWWLSWGFVPLFACGFLLSIIKLLIVVEDTLLRVLIVAVTTAIVIHSVLWLV